MTQEKQDRRTLRTQDTLLYALITLIENKSYDQITVQDIVTQANIGRSTFYAHYQNKDDLLLSGFEHQLDMLARQIVLSEENKLIFDTSMLFQHAYGHYEIYKALIWGSGFKLLIEDGHAILSRKIEERLASLLSDRPAPSMPIPILACAMAGVLLVLLKWWLDNRMLYAPKQMDVFFQNLIMPGIEAILK